MMLAIMDIKASIFKGEPSEELTEEIEERARLFSRVLSLDKFYFLEGAGGGGGGLAGGLDG
ncbi:hypothetical protein EON83_25790 [bacterium]|nr:MAG: hypothetical protein EON83_25790 [bacterium]